MRYALLAVAAIAIAIGALRLYQLATAPAEMPAPSSPPPAPRSPSPSPSPSPSRPPSPSPSPSSPPPPASLAPNGQALLDTLKSSGSGTEAWDDQARSLLASLGQGDTVATYAGCYIAGCAATVQFPSRDAYDRIVDDVARGSAFHVWTGGKKWSPLETDSDGRLTAVLVLYRPD